MTNERRKYKPNHKRTHKQKYAPQTLQTLLPASPLLQQGVLVAPQFAQHSTPNAARAFPFSTAAAAAATGANVAVEESDVAGW